MNEFKNFHPIINFIYFMSVIGMGMFLMHPVYILAGIVCSFAYSTILNGKKAVKFNLFILLPAIITAAVFNGMFNHEGATILTYLPGDNPLTLESLIYGMTAGSIIALAVCWFSCFNKIMTSDKFTYLFGKILPSASLVLSMILRFVPRFKVHLKTIINAQKCIGRDMKSGSIIQRAKNGIKILSIMITWALENAIDTADSMKSRGYGLAGRTAFSIFVFDKRDALALAYIMAMLIYAILGKIYGVMEFVYYPYISATDLTPYGISVFVAYIMLCLTPVIIEVKEGIAWKYIKSKI